MMNFPPQRLSLGQKQGQPCLFVGQLLFVLQSFEITQVFAAQAFRLGEDRPAEPIGWVSTLSTMGMVV